MRDWKRVEQLVAEMMRKAFDLPVKRGGLLQSRASNEAPDVDCPGLWPEVKAGPSTKIVFAIDQAYAEAATKPGKRTPVAVVQRNRKPLIAAWEWTAETDAWCEHVRFFDLPNVPKVAEALAHSNYGVTMYERLDTDDEEIETRIAIVPFVTFLACPNIRSHVRLAAGLDA